LARQGGKLNQILFEERARRGSPFCRKLSTKIASRLSAADLADATTGRSIPHVVEDGRAAW
jgi:hypothetical protein